MDDGGLPSPVRALLFDLGGVLIDIDERGHLQADDYFEHLRQTLGLDLTDEQLLDGWNDIYVGPLAEVGALLLQVKGRLPLYAFSNSNPSHQAFWSARFEEELAVFDRVFVSSELRHRKPDVAAYEHIARAISVPCGEIVFFDDLLENVDGARAAGMRAVHVTSTESVRTELTALGLLAA